MTRQTEQSTPSIPAGAQGAGRIPRIVIWVEREPTGEFIRYVTDLCEAWTGKADLSIWIEPDESPEHRERIGALSCSDRIPFTRRGRSRAITELKRQQPDLILFAGSRAAWHGLAAARAARFSNTVYMALSDDIYRDTSLWNVARTYRCQHTILTGVRHVIVPAYGTRYQYLLRDWIPEDRFLLIPKRYTPEPIDRSTREELRRELGATGSECLVVCPGESVPQARLDWLLRSWALVEERRLPARLALVHSGSEDLELQRLASRLGLERCSFHTAKRPPGHYVAAADCVAMTSLYEMHSRVPLWAMGAGRPIVAFEADGVRMSYSDGVEGLLVPAGQIQTFAESLCALINDPAGRARMGERGLQRVAEFGVDRYQSRARQALDRLIMECTP